MQIPLLETEQVLREPPTPALRAFVVLACWRGAHWKLFPDLWQTAERAHRAAEALPAGWTHRRVLRVEAS